MYAVVIRPKDPKRTPVRVLVAKSGDMLICTIRESVTGARTWAVEQGLLR